MRCWNCKQDMPDGLKYCGHCGVHMKRSVHILQLLFTGKGLIITLAVLLVAAGVFLGSRLLDNAGANDLDIGMYTPKEEDIVYQDDSHSYGYVNNMILLFANSDATEAQIMKAVEHVDGEIVGFLPGVRQYQVQVSACSQEELEDICLELMEFKGVKVAIVDKVATTNRETSSVPNDPWYDYTNIGFATDWNEDYPDGTNWWVEATHVLSAWEYTADFTPIKVGIVDGGFDLSHEDLNITVLNRALNDADDHGTHVAGIIGATHNNGIGISGVLSKVELYGVDCFQSSDLLHQANISTLLGGIDLCLSQGCRVVNMSAGLEYGHPDAVQQIAVETALYLIMMLDSYDQDFLIVQAAGNGDNEGRGVDAETYNGFFASINAEIVALVLQELDAMGVDLERNITVEDVMSSFLVVGNVDYERSGSNYQLAASSNYGRNVTICAPGRIILSTFPQHNNYEYLNGTSMAAPIVSGIAAMVWSVDQDMSAAQVRDIILSTAVEPVRPRLPEDTGRYYMINAEAAVEKALGVRANKPETPTDEDDGSFWDWLRNLLPWLREDEEAEDPTTQPTEGPTEMPTEAPTEEPTQTPTDEPTEAPTEPLQDLSGPGYWVPVTQWTYIDGVRSGHMNIYYRGLLNHYTSYALGMDQIVGVATYDTGNMHLTGREYCIATIQVKNQRLVLGTSTYQYNVYGRIATEIYVAKNDIDTLIWLRLGYDLEDIGCDLDKSHTTYYVYDNSGKLNSARTEYANGTVKVYACEEYKDAYVLYHDNMMRIIFMDSVGYPTHRNPGYTVEFENGYIKDVSPEGYILSVGIKNTDREYRFEYDVVYELRNLDGQ